jgi:hypothetical protein
MFEPGTDNIPPYRNKTLKLSSSDFHAISAAAPAGPDVRVATEFLLGPVARSCYSVEPQLKDQEARDHAFAVAMQRHTHRRDLLLLALGAWRCRDVVSWAARRPRPALGPEVAAVHWERVDKRRTAALASLIIKRAACGGAQPQRRRCDDQGLPVRPRSRTTPTRRRKICPMLQVVFRGPSPL